VGFGLWIDGEERLAWARGTHEYRPMGAAVVAVTDQFRHRDFHGSHCLPAHLRNSFAGFFGSLEDLNEHLRRRARRSAARLQPLRPTPLHVR
jgi:hypothetical protein